MVLVQAAGRAGGPELDGSHRRDDVNCDIYGIINRSLLFPLFFFFFGWNSFSRPRADAV